ncbi:MAG: phosphatidylcholine/phosphatidylserine synthase [Alphaproteobacteria bacterium]|nr:phosphatidylcholine/phosphatidylserine synthase [Alphaproteobacteria bacterium]
MAVHPKQRRTLREQPLSRLFPNMITIGGLCCGLSAMRFALGGRWEIAVGFIIAAAIIDGMDGRVARMLGATSIFGAQLDSLSDFVCFGVAPPIVLYLWQLREIKGLGWAVVLFFAVCCALRLARFNTGILTENQAPWQKKFFTGVPAPAGGILCLLPLIISMQFDQEFTLPPAVSLIYALGVAVLMASRVPTLAAKHVHIRQEFILPFTIGGAFLLVLFIIEPWWTLSAASLAYFASILYAVRYYRRLRDLHAQQISDIAA